MLARALATTLISLFQFTLIYLAAALMFKVRIEGSWPGFIGVGIAFCLLNAVFGLMLATLGRSAPTTRGIASMATLLLVMIGGAWVPAFVFPDGCKMRRSTHPRAGPSTAWTVPRGAACPSIRRCCPSSCWSAAPRSAWLSRSGVSAGRNESSALVDGQGLELAA
jgi:ABC-type multidrug transport system permease subunit